MPHQEIEIRPVDEVVVEVEHLDEVDVMEAEGGEGDGDGPSTGNKNKGTIASASGNKKVKFGEED